MNNKATPTWLLSLMSIVLGGAAIWYTWFRYSERVQNGIEIPWYNWTTLILMGGVGISFLIAAIVLFFNKSGGWAMFKGSFIMAQFTLFANLLLLIVKVILNFDTEKATLFFERLYESPLDKAILTIVIIFISLNLVDKFIRKQKQS
ncbi:hypothetical protein BAMA_02515 [Bacillus manliponensis]|uniref:Uncharacterized protein n=1 Tax=Bacillus manliponensis TaxID=574376 RepID=A0A073JXI5_9BACI|nr:hypothetical protein [Bacillus manliponensis]KEK18966.1 hypothetical protein BAMA_02515 [Bacillus manliponensis]